MGRAGVSGLLGAIQFLTRVPVRLAAPVEHARVLPWFAAVGALIGLAAGGAAWLASLVLPLTLAGPLGVVVGLLITGAFHEDGLADIADAFGGGWDVEQRLEILKDSRHGTYGVSALVSSIGLRMLAAASMPDAGSMLLAFVVAGAVGRACAVIALQTSRPARQSGLGVEVQRQRAWPATVGVLLVAAPLIGFAAGVGAWVVVLLAVLATGAVVALARRKIGGLAGDVLGAVEQVVEIAVWLALVALAVR